MAVDQICLVLEAVVDLVTKNGVRCPIFFLLLNYTCNYSIFSVIFVFFLEKS
jgi:hypothetical protein